MSALVGPRAGRLRSVSIGVAATLGLILLGGPSGAEAARPLQTGIFDGLFRSEDASERQRWLQRADRDGSEYALTTISWSSVAPGRPGAGFDPTDPADPGYGWDTLDAFVRDARASGQDPILTVTSAPAWAEGGGDREGAAAGTWKPRPGDLRDFARALASRYSGSFVDPSAPGAGALPRVKHFQAWTEPNLPGHLTPQWQGRKAKSPDIYRRMLRAFYDGIKSVAASNQVISAGTAPYGDVPGGGRVRPLRFWREVFCLEGRGKLKPGKRCPAKPKLDVLAHHPINTSGGPRRSALHPDDVSTPDLGALQETLRKAEKHRLVKPAGRRPLWVTEFWWESNPPDPREGVKPARHARYVAESLYLFWKAGARVAINLKIRDREHTRANRFDEAGTGLYYLDGSPKPAATAFRFPFVAERRGKGRVEVWGKAPGGGRVVIERKAKGRWKRIGKARAGGNGIFRDRLRHRRKVRLRARAGKETSLAWTLK